MSHTSHPYAVRLGIIRPWKSRWFNPREYQRLLKEDLLLRGFLDKKLVGMLVDSVSIERTQATLNIIIKTARPGFIIGRGGEGIEKLKNEISIFLRKQSASKEALAKGSKPPTLKITIEEIKSPEAHAKVVCEQLAMDLEKRTPFRRVMKQTLSKIMSSKEVKGVKLSLSGRLDGAEMARYEWLKDGQVPLQTLRADVDFARGRAHLPYGDLGIKVWIYRGEIFDTDKKAKQQ